jgi:IS30 family transposase
MMCYRQLSREERYTITALLRAGKSITEIAKELKRSRSTIWRELNRNRTRHDDGYRAEKAHSYATARRKRERRGSHFSPDQWAQVIMLLTNDFSPEQAVHVLRTYANFSISHETIYKYVLYDKDMGGSLYKHLRIMPKKRRKRYNSHDSRGILPGKRHISTRPKEIDLRADIGHWEGDTVIGKDRHHCIVTLVERKTGFVIIKKITARTAQEVTNACIAAILEHKQRFRTITFDNGTEFHGYKILEDCFPVTCYFATPYHSWERGTNENTNGLIRQYLPKRSCMKNITQVDCDRIAHKLNSRPRKRHGFKTPEQLYFGKDPLLHLLLEPKSLILNSIQLFSIYPYNLNFTNLVFDSLY